MDVKYLQILSEKYQNINAAASEIVNLGAIRCLPKGTEFFFSDLHGEYEAFLYLLRSASGVIKAKIELIFHQTVSERERRQLENLIYYPEQYLQKLHLSGKKLEEWQKITIYRLLLVCKEVSSKYTRSKVRKKMPKEYAYILDELLHADTDIDKERYYEEITSSIIEIQIGNNFIVEICRLIQQLSVDSLHIIGDIFDRGPRADIIIEELMKFDKVDIQWGNHDISWMGAATGNKALMANVIRLAIRFNSFDLLEDGYGINLRPLATFADTIYKEDNCDIFLPQVLDENKYAPVDVELAAKMHKAITIMQFKLEGQLIKRHPEYEMDDRILLSKINFEKGTILLEGKEYQLTDNLFPTIAPENPLKLTQEEEKLIEIIAHSFNHSTALHNHIKYLYQKGSMYKCVNGNLLYHGCIPMTKEGAMDEVIVKNKAYYGKELLDYLNQKANRAYFLEKGTKEQKDASDFMWYLWCGKKSPLFGKSKLACFEQYFLGEKETQVEIMNPYYQLYEDEKICVKILEEFGLNSSKCHIINGHVPVKIKDGESPVKGNGKLFVIDGGISKSSRLKTGIAGYTLIYNSHTLNLAEHRAFYQENSFYTEREAPNVIIVEKMQSRVLVGDTDNGKIIQNKINDLKELIKAYRKGLIKEKEGIDKLDK